MNDRECDEGSIKGLNTLLGSATLSTHGEFLAINPGLGYCEFCRFRLQRGDMCCWIARYSMADTRGQGATAQMAFRNHRAHGRIGGITVARKPRRPRSLEVSFLFAAANANSALRRSTG